MNFKTKNLFSAFVYALLFIYAYQNFLNEYFDYLGYLMNNKVNSNIIISLILSVYPVYFHNGFKNISSVITTFVYIVLYVPVILVFYFNGVEENQSLTFIQIIFSCSMTLLFLSENYKFKILKFKQIISRYYIFIICASVIIFSLLIYRNNLQLVSFIDVYELRLDNSIYGNSVIERYLFAWLYTVLIPICFAYGFIFKNKLGFIIGLIGCIVIYAAVGAKAAIITPFLYIILYFIFKKRNFNILSNGLQFISFFIFILTLFDFNVISAVVLNRTIGNGGLLTYWYYDFFLNNPNTYFSHLNIINFFTESYPYKDLILGQVVGAEYWSVDMNANANFWATDGIASIGIMGVPVISVITSMFLILLNSITKKHNKLFVLFCFIPWILNITNTSFFSSLLTGGGGFLVLFFLFKRPEKLINN